MISIEIVRCRIPDLLFRIRKTQTWLAEQTGYSRQRISDYVNMRELMSLKTAAAIAHVLRCSINDLYEYKVSGLGRE